MSAPEAAAAEPVGHGAIHLHAPPPPSERSLLRAITAPVEPADPVMEAVREDILAAIAATA